MYNRLKKIILEGLSNSSKLYKANYRQVAKNYHKDPEQVNIISKRKLAKSKDKVPQSSSRKGWRFYSQSIFPHYSKMTNKRDKRNLGPH